ncbi:MAG: hypothetical protein ACR2LJ_11715 [Acidimicrobiales bacterium]
MRAAVTGCALLLLVTAPPALAGPAGPGASLRGSTGPAGPGASLRGSASAADNPFDASRLAAERLSFVGVVRVTWDDGHGSHSDDLTVRASGGSYEVQGKSTVMAEPGGATMVRHPAGDWDLLWTGTPSPGHRPDLAAKYDLTPAQPSTTTTTVASRPTTMVEVRQAGTVRERLFLDADNGLLLRREQLDLSGHPTRVVAFSSIDLNPQIAAPAAPTRLADHSAHHLSSVSAPVALPGGFRRMDAYREPGAVQVLYSDGLYDLSVFEQRGGLAARDLPASGKPVGVGSAKGWIYAWPGGQVLVWHRGHTVYSLVSEAPVDQLMAVARALPAAGGSSLVERMRRVCRTLVEPIAA